MSTEPNYSGRGFAHWEPVESTYGGEVRVYESSAASGPHIWINVSGECHLDGHPKPHPGLAFGLAPGSTSAHLTMRSARDLRDRLTAAIEHSEERFSE